MTVLGVGMVASVVTRGLEQPDPLEQCNEEPVFFGRAMCPFVDLVGIDPKNHNQPNLPDQDTAKPGDHEQE